MSDAQLPFDALGPADEVEGSAAALHGFVGDELDLSKPYAAVAEGMWRAGWHAVLPLPKGRKHAPPEGWTGNGAPYPSYADVYAWLETEGPRGANVCVRVPGGVVGIDVDDYPGKPGAATLARLIADHGPLPATWRSTARGLGNESGIRFYRVPAGLHFRGGFPGIEIVQKVHRYAVVWPSINPDAGGARYRWYDPTGEAARGFPKVDELPELPDAWVRAITSAGAFTEAVELSNNEVGAWLRECRGGEPCAKMRNGLTMFGEQLRARGARSRHDIALDATRTLIAYGGEGHAGAREAVGALLRVFVEEVTRPGKGGIVRDEAEARKEFLSLAYGAVRLAATKNRLPQTFDPECFMWDDLPEEFGQVNPRGNGVRRTSAPAPETVAAPPADLDARDVPARETATQAEVFSAGGAEPEDTASQGEPETPPAPAAERAEQRPAQTAGQPERTYESMFTEAHLAERVADEVMKNRFCWTKGLGWLGWNGRQWEERPVEDVTEAVRLYFLDWFTAEVRAQAPAERRKAISQQLSAAKIGNITSLCRGLVQRRASDFDADPDVLNTRNGVVDLRTGELLRHDPARAITKCTTVSYHPGAHHKDWAAALEALPPEVAEWYRVRVGQALTGYMSSDDVLVVLQGGGENGKSTINGALGAAFGGYHVLVSDRVLLANPSDHPTELMDLRGARFAVVEETPEARHLNVSRLKKVVGTPQITARLIRKDDVTYDATHCLFLSTNYRPIVAETDHGTWRRLRLCAFPFRFVAPDATLQPGQKHGDPTLRERLLASVRRDGPAARAALAWAIEGARRWYEAGQVMPADPHAIKRDTMAWRAESDQVISYISDRLDFDPESSILASDLLADFNAWLGSGAKAWGDRVLAGRFGGHEEFTTHGVVKSKQRTGSLNLSRPAGLHWIGLGHQPVVPPIAPAWHGIRFKSDDAGGVTESTETEPLDEDPALF